MIGTRFRPGSTRLHRAPAGAKLAALAALGTVLFATGGLTVPAVGLAAAAALACSGAAARPLARDLVWPLAVIVALLAANLVLSGPLPATRAFLRLAALLLAAEAVARTTSPAALQAAIERLLRPAERLRLCNAAATALAIALAIRFIPVIAGQAREIREAQAARGLSAGPLALAVPLLVRVLRQADEVAEAIEARGWPPPEHPK